MRRLACLACLVLAGCGSWNPWAGPEERTVGPPADATLYQCEGNKRLVVRFLDNGQSAMLMLPDRHFRLDAVPGEPGRYSNGRTTLVTQGQETNVEEAGNRLYSGCTSAARAPR